MDHPSPKNTVFGPKMAFLGHFWAEKWPCLDKKTPFSGGGGGALHHPFSGSLILQDMFFGVKQYRLSCSTPLRLGHLRLLRRVQGFSVYRGASRALFAVCIHMKSLVAPQSTNNSMLESKESSRHAQMRPQAVKRDACSGLVPSTLTTQSVEFLSGLLVLMVVMP